MSFEFVEYSILNGFYELESHLNRYLLSMAQYRSLLKVDGVFYAKNSLYISPLTLVQLRRLPTILIYIKLLSEILVNSYLSGGFY